MNTKEMSQEELHEESLIDLAFAVLEERRETMTYQELVDELTKLLGVPKDEMKQRFVQFYTDLNVDGRFLILGENRWGLREWYPVEQIEEESAPTVKARKKKAKKKVVEEEEDDVEELELDEDDLDEFDDDFDDDDDDDDDDDTPDDTPAVADADVEVLNFDEDDDDDDDEIGDGMIVEDEEEDDSSSDDSDDESSPK